MSKFHGFPCSASCLKMKNGEDYCDIFPKRTKTAAVTVAEAAAALAKNLEEVLGGGNCKCSHPTCGESIKPRLTVTKRGETARSKKHVRFLVDDPVHPHREGVSSSRAAPVDCCKELLRAQISSVQMHLDEIPPFTEEHIDPNSAAGASIAAFDKTLAKASRVMRIAKKSQPIFENSGASHSNCKDELDRQYVEMLVQRLKVRELNKAVLPSEKISVSVDGDGDSVKGIRTANIEVLQEIKAEEMNTAKKTLASLNLWKLYNYPKGDSSTESEGSMKYDSDDSYFSAELDKGSEKEKVMDADTIASVREIHEPREKGFAQKKRIADMERDKIASESAIREARMKAFEKKIRYLRKEMDKWSYDLAICEAHERVFEEKIRDVRKEMDTWGPDIAICEGREKAFAEDREIATIKEYAKAQKQHERAALKETVGDRVAEKAPAMKETGEEVVNEEEPKKVGHGCSSSFSDLEKLSKSSQKMNTQRNEGVAEALRKEKADNSRKNKFSLKNIHDDTGWDSCRSSPGWMEPV